MQSILWLAAYPKSGSTWMRLALESLVNGGRSIDINRSCGRPENAALRAYFDDALEIDSSLLTPAEADRLRPQAYEALLRWRGTRIVLKTHDTFRLTAAGAPLFPVAASRAVVLVVRDPRDVAVSYAHHFGVTLDTAITHLASKRVIGNELGQAQFAQHLTPWSDHVASWMDGPIPCLTVRYEDMRRDLAAVLQQIAPLLDIEAPPELLEKVKQATDFSVLQKQETSTGYYPKPEGMARFFRRGIAGGWRDNLSEAQARRIEGDHRAMMQRLGYL